MTLKAYLDNIEAKTGKTPKDFRVLAEKKGLLRDGVKTGEIVNWLKQDFGLGRGHAMAIVLTLQSATQPRASRDEQIDRHFKGEKARWRPPFDRLLGQIQKWGPDVTVAPTNSYLSLLRQGKKFAIVQVTTDRLDIGLKCKGAAATSRFQPAGAWNSMVTHRVQVSDARQIDAEVLRWLRQGYDAAPVTRAKTPAR